MLRLIHCSDWHLPAPLEPGERHALKQWLSTISWRLKRHLRHRREVYDAAKRSWQEADVQRFCVTGDLVNFAMPREFLSAADELSALEQIAPVSLITGNHDALVSSGVTDSRQHWSRWLRGDEATEDIAVWLQDSVAIVGLTSAIPTAPFMAYGTLNERQLRALETQLTRLQQEGMFRIVMVHHPPQAGAAGWRRGLHQAAALRAVLRRTGAELVLHGHLHHPVQAWLPGPKAAIPVFGAGSSSYLAKHAGGHHGHFHLFNATGSPGAWQLAATDYFYQPNDSVFQPGEPRAVRAP